MGNRISGKGAGGWQGGWKAEIHYYLVGDKSKENPANIEELNFHSPGLIVAK